MRLLIKLISSKELNSISLELRLDKLLHQTADFMVKRNDWQVGIYCSRMCQNAGLWFYNIKNFLGVILLNPLHRKGVTPSQHPPPAWPLAACGGPSAPGLDLPIIYCPRPNMKKLVLPLPSSTSAKVWTSGMMAQHEQTSGLGHDDSWDPD
jgi:hypothetical protein